ncbi:ABC transporter permease [Aeromicrobium sp.]|uniref:ABC transporter permease n=1 Tax=Aeromicrobium sp. TaxID=1871063 RepID=UPI00198A2BB4|nr:ABC transporter permease [Aeromicrobium sp.]MBC7630802.1 ABC transporter permease [Aeromicrobium sp.]
MTRRWPLWALVSLIAAWLVAPTLVVIPLSFTSARSLSFPPKGWSLRWYANFFQNGEWLGSLLNSLQLALIVSVAATVLGTLAAYGLSRRKTRSGGMTTGLLLTPMLVPSVVFGVGTYALFLKLHLVGTFAGFAAAHIALAIPFVMIPVSSALVTFDRTMERAARVCGAGRAATFWSVTLPAIAPGVFAGAMFAFVTSFDEVVVSIFLSSPYLETLPVRMFNSLQREVDPTLAAAATLIICFTTALIAISLTTISRRNRVR